MLNLPLLPAINHTFIPALQLALPKLLQLVSFIIAIVVVWSAILFAFFQVVDRAAPIPPLHYYVAPTEQPTHLTPCLKGPMRSMRCVALRCVAAKGCPQPGGCASTVYGSCRSPQMTPDEISEHHLHGTDIPPLWWNFESSTCRTLWSCFAMTAMTVFGGYPHPLIDRHYCRFMTLGLRLLFVCQFCKPLTAQHFGRSAMRGSVSAPQAMAGIVSC